MTLSGVQGSPPLPWEGPLGVCAGPVVTGGLQPPEPKVGRDCRLARGGDPSSPAGPWEPCRLPQSPVQGALEDRGYTGCGSPSVPHQSHRSRLHPLPDVQECEARGCPWWGEGERCLSGRWARGPPSAATPRATPPSPLGWVWGEEGRYRGDPRPLPGPPQGLRGELRRSGRQLDWEGSRWPGARLISC